MRETLPPCGSTFTLSEAADPEHDSPLLHNQVLTTLSNHFPLLNLLLKMPLGILEDPRMAHVPGTAPLETIQNSSNIEIGAIDTVGLKHDKSGKFVLVPQPSDDPNDPLNWPRWRKEMFIVTVIWQVGCVGGLSHCHLYFFCDSF